MNKLSIAIIVVCSIFTTMSGYAQAQINNTSWTSTKNNNTEAFVFVGSAGGIYVDYRGQASILTYKQEGTTVKVAFKSGFSYSGRVNGNSMTLTADKTGKSINLSKVINNSTTGKSVTNKSSIKMGNPFTNKEGDMVTVYPELTSNLLGLYEFTQERGLYPSHQIFLQADGTGYSHKQSVDEARSGGYTTYYKYIENEKESIRWGVLGENKKIDYITAIVPSHLDGGQPTSYSDRVSVKTPVIFIEYPNKKVSLLYVVYYKGTPTLRFHSSIDFEKR